MHWCQRGLTHRRPGFCRRVDVVNEDMEVVMTMSGRFDAGCRRVVGDAQQSARRLGHPFVGTEHVLLGLSGQHDAYCVQVLPTHGIDVQRLRGAVGSMIGDGLDPDALASIGIAVDRVRRLVESRFGAGALRPPDRWVVPEGHLPPTRRARAVLGLAVLAVSLVSLNGVVSSRYLAQFGRIRWRSLASHGASSQLTRLRLHRAFEYSFVICAR